MNLTIQEASLYVHKLDANIVSHRNVEVVLSPAALALPTLNLQIDHRKFPLAAPKFYWRDEGTYTGESSAHQLRGLVKYALVGHSERRHVFHENDKDIRAKVQAAVRNQITPILCVGETAHERALGETESVLHDQGVGGILNLTAEEVENIVIAYEPVWAISSGKDFASHAVASANDAGHAAKIIRRQIAHPYGKKAADKVQVLYGASSNSQNAPGFLAESGIDGLLVGGASLIMEEFKKIIEEAHNASKVK